MPSALMFAPSTRGSATQRPFGLALSARQTWAGLPKPRKLVVRSPSWLQPLLPQSGGMGTPALRHSSMYSRPAARVAALIRPFRRPKSRMSNGRLLRRSVSARKRSSPSSPLYHARRMMWLRASR